MGSPGKKWIERKKGLDVARIIVHDRSEWQGFVRGNAWDVAWGMNP